MIRSAVTICLVPEARGGPFIFWDDLAAGCAKAAALGFDAVEVFPPSPESLESAGLGRLLKEHRLKLAAVGTGAGWVKHRLSLTSADAAERRQARQFIRSIVDAAGSFGASAIIGSMQGRWGVDVGPDDARKYLAEALIDLGESARRHDVPLLYEPLNRYETNLINTVSQGVQLLQSLGLDNVKLLADLFHMNIEEIDLSTAIRAGRGFIGHLHLADSNRRPAGNGHTDFASVATALRESDYQGYVSAEALPYPDPDAAARQTIEAYRRYFQSR